MAVSAAHLSIVHGGQSRVVFVYAGIAVGELQALLSAAFKLPSGSVAIGVRDVETGSIFALEVVGTSPQGLGAQRAHELVVASADAAAGNRLMEDAFAKFVDAMVESALIDDEGADRVVELGEERDPLVRTAMELFLPAASAQASSPAAAQAAIDQLVAAVVELASLDWNALEQRRAMLNHCLRLRRRAVLSRAELTAAKWLIVQGDSRLTDAFAAYGDGRAYDELRLVTDLSHAAAALRVARSIAHERKAVLALQQQTALLGQMVQAGLLERADAVAARELAARRAPAVLGAFREFAVGGGDERRLREHLLRCVAEARAAAAVASDPLVDVVADLVSEGSLTALEGAWLRGRRVAGHDVLSGAVELYSEEGDVSDLQDTLLRAARHFRKERSRDGHELAQLIDAFERRGALDADELALVRPLVEQRHLVILAAYEVFAVDLDADELMDTLKVSVLLYTVTFYANLAHSLTRSP